MYRQYTQILANETRPGEKPGSDRLFTQMQTSL